MTVATGGVAPGITTITLNPGERVIRLSRSHREPTPIYEAMCGERGWVTVEINLDGRAIHEALLRYRRSAGLT